jgi:L-fuconolactonase
VTVVDAHAHVFLPASAAHPRAVDALVPAERAAPAEDLLALMDANGVDQAVLVPLDRHDRYVAETLAAHPARFAAVAVATDAELHGDVAALRRRRAAFPFGALRTQWLGAPGQPVNEGPAQPLFRHLAAEGLVLWAYLPPDQLPLLDGVLRAVPGLQVVLNHLGFCPHDMRVDAHSRPRFDDPFPPADTAEVLRLAAHPGVHVMLSGHYALSAQDPPYADLDAVTQRILDAYGPGRLLWASDHPWPSAVPGYAVLRGLPAAVLPGLSADELAAVTGGNARRLFPALP